MTEGRWRGSVARVGSLTGVLRRSLALLQRAAGREFRTAVGLQVVSGAGAAAVVFFAGRLAGDVIDGTGAEPLHVTAFLAVTIAALGASIVKTERQRVLSELIEQAAVHDVLTAVGTAELVRFDDPAFHDQLVRALEHAGSRPVQLVAGLLGLVSASVTVVAMAVALAFISPLLLAILLVSVGPLWWAGQRASRLGLEFSRGEAERDRQRAYLTWLSTARTSAGEIKAYRAIDFVRNRITVLHDARIAGLRRLVRRRAWLGLMSSSITVMIAGAVILLVGRMTSAGQLSVEDATVASGGLLLMAQRLQSLFSSASSVLECALFLEDVEAFTSTTAQDASAPAEAGDSVQRVQLFGVGFSYPSAAEPALHDVTLDLERGSLVALVGENGSGKTTLARVLAGLYSPSIGRMVVNGQTVASSDAESYRMRVAVMGQDHVQLLVPVRENIALGALGAALDEERLDDAATFGGIRERIATLPFGFDTLLGTEYTGGSGLSGGEWQRLSIARAWFRNADLIVLDEPTSALDARSEMALIARLRELAGDKIVLLVSHRFATVVDADHIVVMHRGRVTEEGTHTSLLGQGGLYAAMYSIQAEAFR